MIRAILSIFILLFSCFSLNAQSEYSFVSHQRWANYNAMDVDDNGIVLAGFSGECDTPYFTYLDKATGAELWSTNAGVMYYGWYTDVIFAADSTIWASGIHRSADDGGDFQAILTHLTAAGELISYREVFDDQAYEGRVSQIIELPDGQFFWSTGQTVHLLDSTGETVFVWEFEDRAVDFLSAVNAESFVVSVQGEVIEQRIMFNTRTTIAEETGGVQDLAAIESGFYWVNDDELVYYDNTSEEITRWALPEALEDSKLFISESEVFLYRIGNSPHHFGRLLPDQSGVVMTNTWATEDRRLLQLMKAGENFFHLGTDMFESSTDDRALQHAYVRRTPGLPSVAGPDIGVSNVDITVDSISIKWIEGIIRITADVVANIEITNHGEEPIETFLLASPVSSAFNCAEQRFYERIAEPLVSQESIVLSYRISHPVPYNADEEGNILVDLNFCFFTAAPNQTLDRDPSNDHACENLMLVPNENVFAKSKELLVFPNPVADQLNIQVPQDNIEQVSLLDEMGRLVLAKDGGDGHQLFLSTARLPSGVYWLQVVMEEEILTKRVVKI